MFGIECLFFVFQSLPDDRELAHRESSRKEAMHAWCLFGSTQWQLETSKGRELYIIRIYDSVNVFNYRLIKVSLVHCVEYMDTNDLIVIIVFMFLIGSGLGFYTARIFFGG